MKLPENKPVIETLRELGIYTTFLEALRVCCCCVVAVCLIMQGSNSVVLLCANNLPCQKHTPFLTHTESWAGAGTEWCA